MDSATEAARDYLENKLGDRKGFRQLKDEIITADPSIFEEIVNELAKVLRDYAQLEIDGNG